MKKGVKKQKSHVKSIKFIELFLTFFYVGKFKICPGTFGSIAALPFWIITNLIFAVIGINNILTFAIFWLVLISVIFVYGISICNIYLKQTGKKGDPQEIVIDEVVGQLITFLSAVVFGSYFMLRNIDTLKGQVDCESCKIMSTIMITVVPIIMFRIFDVVKPCLIGYCDKKIKGGLGIMLDDLVAGLFASVSLIPIYYIYYGHIVNFMM